MSTTTHIQNNTTIDYESEYALLIENNVFMELNLLTDVVKSFDEKYTEDEFRHDILTVARFSLSEKLRCHNPSDQVKRLLISMSEVKELFIDHSLDNDDLDDEQDMYKRLVVDLWIIRKDVLAHMESEEYRFARRIVTFGDNV